MFATAKSIGLFNMGAMEPFSYCPSTQANYTAVHIDTNQAGGTTLLYGALDTGDIIAYELKASENKCVAQAKFHHRAAGAKIGSTRGNMVAWSGNLLSIFSTIAMERAGHIKPVEMEIEGAEGEAFL